MPDTVTWITVAATVATGAVAVAQLIVRTRSRERLAAIEKGGAGAARVVSDAIAMFNLPVQRLTPKRTFELAQAEIQGRAKRASQRFWLLVIVITVLACMTIFLAHDQASKDSKIAEDPSSRQTPSDVKITEGPVKGEIFVRADARVHSVRICDTVMPKAQKFIDSQQDLGLSCSERDGHCHLELTGNRSLRIEANQIRTILKQKTPCEVETHLSASDVGPVDLP